MSLKVGRQQRRRGERRTGLGRVILCFRQQCFLFIHDMDMMDIDMDMMDMDMDMI